MPEVCARPTEPQGNPPGPRLSVSAVAVARMNRERLPRANLHRMKNNNRIPKRLAKKLANVARAIEPHRGEIAEWTSPVSETIAMGHIRPALEREGVLVLTSVDRIESMDTQRCGRVTVAHTTHALVVADSGEKILLNSCGVAPTHPSTQIGRASCRERV